MLLLWLVTVAAVEPVITIAHVGGRLEVGATIELEIHYRWPAGRGAGRRTGSGSGIRRAGAGRT